MRSLFIILIFTSLLAGCSSNTPNQPQQTSDASPAPVTVEAPAENAKTDESPVFVIDVRSKEEWDTGHIETAVLIPHTEIAERIGEVTDNKDAKIVLYCAVGGRAGKAKTALENLGFTNVENGGGYDDMKGRLE